MLSNILYVLADVATRLRIDLTLEDIIIEDEYRIGCVEFKRDISFAQQMFCTMRATRVYDRTEFSTLDPVLLTLVRANLP